MFLTFILISTTSNAGMIDHFMSWVNDNCEGTGKLLIKKSAIELIKTYKEKECHGFFTKKIISKCEKITCENMIEEFSNLKEKETGNVIGH